MSNNVKLDAYTSVIKKIIGNYEKIKRTDETGIVITNGDGIVTIGGLRECMLNELLEFENGALAIAFSLQSDVVGAIMLDNYENIIEGTEVRRTNKIVSVPVGDELLGRVVNAMGQPIDNLGPIEAKKFESIEKAAPGVMMRKSVNQPLSTGILSIDAMFPIGRGQRELIIGDRQTGKTSIAIDTILNQKGKSCLCIYVAIGQKNSTVTHVIETLRKHDALSYTTVVVASASDLPALKYIAPFTGVTIAEEWMLKGKDVLIVYDDLSKHAIAYRTISLLLQLPPGREAYPGDVFYLHSRLLERAGRIDAQYGGGSISALPIIETQAGDISAYIPTNVISITDGQLFTKTSLFNSGQRPAIDPGLSVSRVGSAAQISGIKSLSGTLKLELAQYAELDAFSQFGSDLDINTRTILEHGKRIMLMLKQPVNNPLDQIDEIMLLFLIQKRYIKWIEPNLISQFRADAIKAFQISPARGLLKVDSKLDENKSQSLHRFAKKLILDFTNKLSGYDLSKFGEISELQD